MRVATALVDDDNDAIQNGVAWVKKKNELFVAWDTPIKTSDNFKSWVNWCANTAPEDLLVILDLGLQSPHEVPFESSQEICSDFTVADLTMFKTVGTVDGIFAGVAAIRSPRIKRLLIIIASGRGETALVKEYLDKQAVMVADKSVHIIYATDNKTLRRESFVVDIFTDAVLKWKRFFPTFHPDPWIDNCISKWIAFYRELDEKGSGRYFCQHGIAGETCTIQGSAGEYIVALNDMFALNGALAEISDINGIKALLMLGARPSEGVENEQWFKQWPINHPEEYDAKKISKELLIPLLQAAFELDVDVQCNEMRLPSSPALPFVLSLRVLVQAISNEAEGSFLHSSLKVVLKENGGGYRLSIPLAQSEGKQFGLAKTWVRKVEQGSSEITRKGVCAALWSASLAKVDVSATAVLDPVERALLCLFDGPGRPVVGVSFAPHFIHLHWS
ncbi:MAG: hypothetical protein ABL869_03840 [Candidatus Nitrotoga sp.]